MTQPAGGHEADNQPHVYVVMGRAERDFTDCAEVLSRLPARLTVLPFIQDEDELIEAARDADALIVASTLVTRKVMTTLERLKVVMKDLGILR